MHTIKKIKKDHDKETIHVSDNPAGIETHYRQSRNEPVDDRRLIADDFAQSDGEKSDQDLVVDDASEGPSSPVVNGASSPPRENGLDKAVVTSLMTAGVQTIKKDVAPPSPRSGTSSNASTPSTKKMEEREKTATPKPLTPTSGSGASGTASKSTTSSKLMQGVSVQGAPNSLSGVAAYSPHYPSGGPPPPPPHHIAPTGQHPHVDMMAYNGYMTSRTPVSLQQIYDPHAALRAPLGIPGGKP